MRYSTTVERIRKRDDGNGFVVTVTSTARRRTNTTAKEDEASEREDLHCRYLVMANGLSTPNIPKEIHGIDLATGYENLPPNGTLFEVIRRTLRTNCICR